MPAASNDGEKLFFCKGLVYSWREDPKNAQEHGHRASIASQSAKVRHAELRTPVCADCRGVACDSGGVRQWRAPQALARNAGAASDGNWRLHVPTNGRGARAVRFDFNCG